MSDVNDWLKERRAIHNAATEGPWYKTPNDRILSESVQWPEGDDYDVAGGLGRDGAVVEAIHDFDGNAIADAHNTLPALLTAVEKVLELHTKSPGVRWYGIPRADKSEHYCMADREAWPCSTRRAFEGAIK